MIDAWQDLSAVTQDFLILGALLLPGIVIGALIISNSRPWSLVGALIYRYRWTNLIFIILIGISIGTGVALLAQERGLRSGMARAADKFDLVLAAPGSKIDMMLATVYLQPIDAPLLDGHLMQEVLEDPKVSLAAPIAYGDSYKGAPVIGSTREFVLHLAGQPVEGRLFENLHEAVAGAKVNLEMNDVFTPAHGHGSAADEQEIHDHELRIVGKLSPTGSPWDRAIIVPVESVWEVHGLGDGRGDDNHEQQLGPPYDPKHFPGTPAILVRAEKLWANYALASKYTRDSVMAFFPGTVLARLHNLLGDIRQMMSVMAMLSQILVAAGIFAALVVLARLFSRRFALLRALGAPRKFIFSVMWSYTAALLSSGALLGVVFGYLIVSTISTYITMRTDIVIRVSLDWPEFQLVAAFISITLVLACIPAAFAHRQNVVKDLRMG